MYWYHLKKKKEKKRREKRKRNEKSLKRTKAIKALIYLTILQTMSIRRKQLTVTGKTEVSTSTPSAPHHPGYAPNAAFHAIKRHALEFVNPKELMVSTIAHMKLHKLQ